VSCTTEILQAAYAREKLEDFGSDSFREGLEILVEGLEAHPRVTRFGRDLLYRQFQDALCNRLCVIDYRKRHPELRDQKIEAPVLILGMPRTGTTALSHMLGCDPRWRTLLNWEAGHSVPPPTTATLRSDPRCTELKKAQQALFAQLPAEDPPPHWEWADGPTECIYLHAQDFKTLLWEVWFPCPEYESFCLNGDLHSAYAYERQVLQLLQSRAPGRWLLKTPSHALFIEEVLATFPDASLIWIHRDPFDALTSLCGTVAYAHRTTMGEVDLAHIQQTYPNEIAQYVQRPLAALKDFPAQRLHHIDYGQIFRDPLGEVRRIYRWLGLALGPEVAAAMQAWLEQDRHRQAARPRYRLEDFGLSRDALAAEVDDYLAFYKAACAAK